MYYADVTASHRHFAPALIIVLLRNTIRIVVSLRYSRVLPTFRVFRSGHIKWKSILYFLNLKVVERKNARVSNVLSRTKLPNSSQPRKYNYLLSMTRLIVARAFIASVTKVIHIISAISLHLSPSLFEAVLGSKFSSCSDTFAIFAD